MTAFSDQSSEAVVNRSALLAGAVLVGVGGLLFAAGAAITAATAYGAVRRWADRLEEPPSQMARRRLAQAKAAAAAGMERWRLESGNSAANRQPSVAG